MSRRVWPSETTIWVVTRPPRRATISPDAAPSERSAALMRAPMSGPAKRLASTARAAVCRCRVCARAGADRRKRERRKKRKLIVRDINQSLHTKCTPQVLRAVALRYMKTSRFARPRHTSRGAVCLLRGERIELEVFLLLAAHLQHVKNKLVSSSRTVTDTIS